MLGEFIYIKKCWKLLSQSVQNDNGEFNWDEKTQGFILGAFYYGFCMTQIPGGFLAEKYGGKMVFGGGILMSALLSLTYPTAARTSSDLFIVLRALQGFFEGVTMPALYVMNSKWLPESEKAFLSTITFCGMIAESHIRSWKILLKFLFILRHGAWNYNLVPCLRCSCWRAALGVCLLRSSWNCPAMVCALVLLCFSLSEGLQTHFAGKFISRIERKDHHEINPNLFYQIQAELKYIEAETSDGKNQSKKLPNPPLRHILTSKPFFALVMAQMGNFWAYYTLMTGSSKYLSAIQHFSLEEVKISRYF